MRPDESSLNGYPSLILFFSFILGILFLIEHVLNKKDDDE